MSRLITRWYLVIETYKLIIDGNKESRKKYLKIIDFGYDYNGAEDIERIKRWVRYYCEENWMKPKFLTSDKNLAQRYFDWHENNNGLNIDQLFSEEEKKLIVPVNDIYWQV